MTAVSLAAEHLSLDWYRANQAYLMAYFAWLKYRIRAESLALHDQAEESQLLATLAELKRQLPMPATIDRLRYLFNLTEFEVQALLMAAGQEFDSSFLKPEPEKAALTACFSLVLSALPEPQWYVMAPTNPLRYWNLVLLEDPRSLAYSPLRVPESVLHFLTGMQAEEDMITLVSHEIAPEVELDQANWDVVRQLLSLWHKPEGESRGHSDSDCFTLTGEQDEIKQDIAAAFSAELGQKLKLLPAFFIPTKAEDLLAFVRIWRREAVLHQYLIYLDCSDQDEEDRDQQRAIDFFIDKLPGPVLCGSPAKRRYCRKRQFGFEVKKPSPEAQRSYWQQQLAADPELGLPADPLLGAELSELTAHFDLSFREIQLCLYKNEALETDSSLWEVCRQANQAQMDTLAQKIEPSPGALDLILPEREKMVLEDIITHVRYRSRVYQEWNFLKNSQRGQGLSVLFTGASGTGKTTAAEYLALKLNLDLYRIDLSSVVSKYIGETEKNLRRIFAGAERSGAILLFDEADAIFGKRSEVKDSHDRYANQEINYLLQRMESFKGLAILTSNFKQALDQAFIRRLRFIVQFPFPSPQERELIWRALLPAQIPSRNLNFQKLAQLNIAGGEIRNIALHACFLAARDGCLEMRHCLQATRNEFLKLEKPLSEMEIRGWL